MTFATSPEALERHSREVLGLVSDHLAGKHNDPEDCRTECLACDHFRLELEVDRLRGNLGLVTGSDLAEAWENLVAAFDREKTRTEMMAYQRGAVLDAIHRFNAKDAIDRIEEIFSAGMSAEVERGYGDLLAAVEQDRDRLSEELKVVRRERAWLLQLVGYDELQEFRRLVRAAEHSGTEAGK